MSKSVLLDANFSGLEQRVIAQYRSQAMSAMMDSMKELIKSGKSVMTTHDMVVTTPTDDISDALLYGMAVHSFVFDEYSSPTPHCQKKVFNIIDKFWSGKQLGLYGQYIEQLNRNPKTKDIFKGKSTSHHYPWYKRGSKY